MFSLFNRPPRPESRVPRPVSGPMGPMGAQGPPGPPGPPGRTGVQGTGVTHIHGQPVPNSPIFHAVEDAPADHPVPMRSHAGDAGHDLHAVQGGTIPSGQRRAIPVGYSVELDPATYGKIEGRSGLARDWGLQVLGGVIDSGYTGELVVILYNSGRDIFRYERGDRIAQLVVQPMVAGGAVNVDGERGANGFGSTDDTRTKESMYNLPAVDDGVVEDVVVYPILEAAEEWNTAEADLPEDTSADGPEDPSDYLPEDLDTDMVNHPPHYRDHHLFQGECWHYAQWMVYGQGAAFKYLWRAESKDTVVSNLDKAHWYLANGGLAGSGRRWVDLDVDRPELATALTEAVTDAEDHGEEYTLGQFFVATAAVYTSLALPEDALEYVQRALDWYQRPDNL